MNTFTEVKCRLDSGLCMYWQWVSIMMLAGISGRLLNYTTQSVASLAPDPKNGSGKLARVKLCNHNT